LPEGKLAGAIAPGSSISGTVAQPLPAT